MVGPAVSAAAVVDASAATPVDASACLACELWLGSLEHDLFPRFFLLYPSFHHFYSLLSHTEERIRLPSNLLLLVQSVLRLWIPL
jgi:hypothetical protein